jgi:hypothetical protein
MRGRENSMICFERAEIFEEELEDEIHFQELDELLVFEVLRTSFLSFEVQDEDHLKTWSLISEIYFEGCDEQGKIEEVINMMRDEKNQKNLRA